MKGMKNVHENQKTKKNKEEKKIILKERNYIIQLLLESCCLLFVNYWEFKTFETQCDMWTEASVSFLLLEIDLRQFGICCFFLRKKIVDR